MWAGDNTKREGLCGCVWTAGVQPGLATGRWHTDSYGTRQHLVPPQPVLIACGRCLPLASSLPFTLRQPGEGLTSPGWSPRTRPASLRRPRNNLINGLHGVRVAVLHTVGGWVRRCNLQLCPQRQALQKFWEAAVPPPPPPGRPPAGPVPSMVPLCHPCMTTWPAWQPNTAWRPPFEHTLHALHSAAVRSRQLLVANKRHVAPPHQPGATIHVIRSTWQRSNSPSNATLSLINRAAKPQQAPHTAMGRPTDSYASGLFASCDC